MLRSCSCFFQPYINNGGRVRALRLPELPCTPLNRYFMGSPKPQQGSTHGITGVCNVRRHGITSTWTSNRNEIARSLIFQAVITSMPTRHSPYLCKTSIITRWYTLLRLRNWPKISVAYILGQNYMKSGWDVTRPGKFPEGGKLHILPKKCTRSMTKVANCTLCVYHMYNPTHLDMQV